MRASPTLAISGFALRTNLRSWRTRTGVLAGLLITLLGPLLAWHGGRGWSYDPDLGWFGFFVAALFLARSGLEEQRAHDLDTFLALNYTGRFRHALAMVVSLVTAWGLLCVGTFLTTLALSGDPGSAAWLTTSWGLRGLLVLGFVPWVEARVRLHVPLLLPALVYFGMVLTLSLVLDEQTALRLFAAVERGRPETLQQLAAQAAVVFAAATLAFLTAAWLGERVRGPGRLMVSFRHGVAPRDR